MPSKIILKVKCSQHLIRFMEVIYGQQPIVFPTTDNFNRILNHLLVKPTRTIDEMEDEENYKVEDHPDILHVRLNYIEYKNVLVYNCLTERGENLFVRSIKNFFKMVFRNELDESRNFKYSVKDGIYHFMEKYNLPEDTFDLLSKDYYSRYMVEYKRRISKRRKQNKKIVY